jgi:FlaA1/EpsC-like NDP-sugar epimerase
MNMATEKKGKAPRGRLWWQRYLYLILFILLDYAAIVLAETAAVSVDQLINPAQPLRHHFRSYIYGWIPLIYIIFLGRSRAYREMQPILDTVRSIFHSIGFATLTTLVIFFFVAPGILNDRAFLLMTFLFMLVNIYVLRFVTYILMKKLHLFYVPVILIGAGRTAEHVLRFFHNDLGYRYDIIGVMDDAPISRLIPQRFLLYGSLDKAPQIIGDSRVQQVII